MRNWTWERWVDTDAFNCLDCIGGGRERWEKRWQGVKTKSMAFKRSYRCSAEQGEIGMAHE